MAILLLAETANGALSPSTAKALTAAKEIGGPIHVLVVGPGLDAAAASAAKLAGVEKVLYAGDAARHAALGLDRWGEAWAQMRDDTCAATQVRGEQSAELLDLREQRREPERLQRHGLAARVRSGEEQGARGFAVRGRPR